MSDPDTYMPAPEALVTRTPEPAAALGWTQPKLDALLSWLQRTPHDLPTAARAAGVSPAEALIWYLYGQWPGCTVPALAAFSAQIAGQRAEQAAANHARTIKAAEGGQKRTITTRPDGTVEEKVEDVLPASWAIERLDTLAASSQLACYPGSRVTDELAKMTRQDIHDGVAHTLSDYDALPAPEKP